MFSNTGNVNTLLRNGKYCTDNKPESCTPFDNVGRVYAQASWSMPLPEGSQKGKGYIEYGLFNGQIEQKQQFAL